MPGVRFISSPFCGDAMSNLKRFCLVPFFRLFQICDIPHQSYLGGLRRCKVPPFTFFISTIFSLYTSNGRCSVPTAPSLKLCVSSLKCLLKHHLHTRQYLLR